MADGSRPMYTRKRKILVIRKTPLVSKHFLLPQSLSYDVTDELCQNREVKREIVPTTDG